MNKTLGDLVDRLSVLNIKLYMVQDKLLKAQRKGKGLSAELTERLVSLNLERNKTMTAIDETLLHAIATGRVDVDPRTKVL